MLIDWFTVLAQAANFLILVWLMKRFLYRPILNALDAREKRIADALADADAKEVEAAREREEYRRKNEALDAQQAALLKQAAAAAADEKQRLLEEARKESDAMRSTLQGIVESEYRNLREEIAHRTRQEAFALARQALADLAGASLEARMVEVFAERLRVLDAEERKQLAVAPGQPAAPVLVRSAFGLDASQRALIEGAIRETVAPDAALRFEVVPALAAGIELIMRGQKAAWSVADYVASLEKDVDDLLKAHRKTGPAAQERT